LVGPTLQRFAEVVEVHVLAQDVDGVLARSGAEPVHEGRMGTASRMFRAQPSMKSSWMSSLGGDQLPR